MRNVVSAQRVIGGWAVTLVWLAPMWPAQANEWAPVDAKADAIADEPPPVQEPVITTRLEQANAIVGSELYDSRGRLVGLVSQLLLSRELDRAALVLVALADDLRNVVPVPVTALRRNASARLAIDMRAADVAQVPRMFDDGVLEVTSRRSLEKIDQFFRAHSDRYRTAVEAAAAPAGAEAAAPKAKASAYQRLTKLVGLDIRARDADMAANLEDLVVDLVDGKVLYAVLSINPPYRDEMLAAVPWSAVEIRPQLGRGNVDAPLATLQSLAFTATNLPSLQDPAFASRVYQAFGRTPYWQVYGYVPRKIDPKTAWLEGSTFASGFDFAEIKTFVGYVYSVGTFAPATGAADGLRLRVRTQKGNLITVLVGPKAYTDKRGLVLHQGSPVTVIGGEASLDGRVVVVASEVQIPSQRVRVRDFEGRPLWLPTDIE